MKKCQVTNMGKITPIIIFAWLIILTVLVFAIMWANTKQMEATDLLIQKLEIKQ